MKGLLLALFVTFSFVPFAFPARDAPSYSAAVVDIEGRELKLGDQYYAVTNSIVHPEGLCLTDISKQGSFLSENETTSCPHDVVQCSLFYDPFVGLPIVFSTGGNGTAGNSTAGNLTADATVVQEGTSYSIQFAATGSSCAKETVWGLASEDSAFTRFVTTDPAATAVKFQLRREGFGYTISYCVTLPLPHIPLCYGVGLVQDGSNNRLAVGWGSNPVQFFFGRNPTKVTNHATS